VKVSAVLRPLVLSLVLAGSLAAGAHAAESAARDFKSPLLNRAQVDALLAKPEQVVVIDLRRPDEHQKGAFPVFLSIQAADLEKNLGYIPRDRQVLTVSNHSGRSGKAADLLASKGFKVAGAVGAEYYAEEGGKLHKIVAPPPAAADAAKPAAATATPGKP
jgi:rhodanese-related sulfurtransferase